MSRASAIALCAALLLGGCHAVAVEARAPDPSPTRTGATTVWVVVWGLVQTPKVTAECDNTHVHKATMRVTLPGWLLSLVTIGLVIPVKVAYICAAEPGTIEGTPPPPPPSAGGGTFRRVGRSAPLDESHQR